MFAFLQKVFGTPHDRVLKKFKPLLTQINALEPTLKALSDEELKARTPWFKERLAQGESLDDLLVETFATVREAAQRTLGQRHFDVQLLGGMVLHKGMIAEMKTGEGKTLVATAPLYLNALEGKGAHLVTVNDYLVRRDAQWMGKIYNFLGLSVGCIVSNMPDSERKAAYAADITYGTNNEFGFDYLRDNMKFYEEEVAQRALHYAIVDEVDNILIDEARTPLIISGPAEESSELYEVVDKLIPLLKDTDYEKDEKSNTVTLTEDGTLHIEALVKERGLLKGPTLYDINNVSLVHHINQALKAHKNFQRDKEYIVEEGEIIIIDEFTGRKATGRRYSEGLHQALEAKEGVKVQIENQTLASITFQNYFRLYDKLGGMTGTADSDADELSEIYKLNVVVLPPNLPLARKDLDDEVYRTAAEKYQAVLKLVQECHARNQPVLLGTISIEKSELLSGLLKAHKIPHKVLNARYHEQEAEVIAQAGQPGAVTIATNMAGRGTDIRLGGNAENRIKKELTGLTDAEKYAHEATRIIKEVEEQATIARDAGGLYVIATERYESRRIDNQLRGRAGRQGDPGASKFFLSLEDDLMRAFGSQRLDGMLKRLGLEEGEAITHPWVNKALEKAQGKIDARNFDIRKQLLQFDNVMNDQRKVIYEQRREIMSAQDVSETVEEMLDTLVEQTVIQYIPPHTVADQWDMTTLSDWCRRVLNLDLPLAQWAQEEGVAEQEIMGRLKEALKTHLEKKEQTYGSEVMKTVEKSLLLRVLDHSWKEHLLALDHLRQGIHLRAYGQRDPLNEYKSEAFVLFQDMLDRMREPLATLLCHFEIHETMNQDAIAHTILEDEEASSYEKSHASIASGVVAGESGFPDFLGTGDFEKTMKETRGGEAMSRNAPCFCGSGKRYKHCHGRS